MRRRLIVAGALLAALAAVAVLSLAHPGVRAMVREGHFQLVALREGIRIERDVMIPMPDGVRLATDLYLPPVPEGGLPTVLVRLPYGKDSYGGALQWVGRVGPHGYAVVIQDMRGRFGSEGVFAPYEHEAVDGSATLDWIAAQPWSSGRIATAGCSALGDSQLILAKTQNPHQRAMIAEGAGAMGTAGASRGYFGFYQGGIPLLAELFGWFAFQGGKTAAQMDPAAVDPAKALWELPTGTLVSRHRADPTDFDDMISSFEDAGYWREMGFLEKEDRFAAPGLHVNTWHDIVAGTFEVAALMRANATTDAARNHQHVIIGPGDHCRFVQTFEDGRVGDLPVEPSAALDYLDIYRAWLDHWLRDGPMPDLAPYTYYVLQADRWEEAETWPPAGAVQTRWYLGQDGTLAQEPPDEGMRDWLYDPGDPTPTLGGPICCTGKPDLRTGPIDQRPNAARDDVLVFRSEPLEAPMSIVGDIHAEIALSSSAPDTDLVAILVDIQPDGAEIPIQLGALRVRYRDGYDFPRLMRPGEVVRAPLAIGPIAYEVSAGHRIGLHLSSSSFPRLERNLNTGGDNWADTAYQVAHNRIHLGAVHDSALILPVLAAGDEPR
jgi:uncharacterized protein